MNQQPPAVPHWHAGSLLQIGLSLLGVGGTLLGTAGIAVLTYFNRGSQNFHWQPILRLAWIALFFALLAAPSAYFAARRVLGQPAHLHSERGFVHASLALLLWPAAVGLARYSSQASPFLQVWLFPPAAIVASFLPIWWTVGLARRGLRAGSWQRSWGVFNFALFFSTPLIFVIEIFGMLLVLIGIIVFISANAGARQALTDLYYQVQALSGDEESLRAVYAPLLRQPLVIAGIFFSLAVATPLCEELFKPLAVWFLLRRSLTPADGLTLGAIAGAGFAIPETTINLVSLGSNPEWLGLAIGRAGTSVLHVTTAALTGMAIAYAWQGRRYLALAAAYLASSVLHGLWNALNTLMALAQTLLGSTWGPGLSSAIIAILGLQVVLMLGLLILLNRRLRPAPSPVTPLPQSSPTPTS